MSIVREILKTKGSAIWSVSPNDTVLNALKFMAEKNAGAVIVLEGSKIVGVFSERDFARHCAKRSVNPVEVLVKEMMTTSIHCIDPKQSLEECMSLMTTKRIRHLPVIEDDKLIGLISIGDVVNRIIQDHKFSITQLERYITGEP